MEIIDNGGWDYVHAHSKIFNDAEVELHYRLSISHNLFKNRKIQGFWGSHVADFFAGKAELPCGEIVCPSDYIHLFYLLIMRSGTSFLAESDCVR